MFSTNELIGQRLRELRIQHKKTQTELGKMLHMHYTMYGKIEAGQRKLSMENCIKLANYYGVTTEYINMGVDPEAIDFYRKTGLNQRTIDALVEDPVFRHIVNLLTKYRGTITKAVADGAQAVHDVEMQHLGEEIRTAEGYSTMLDFPWFNASRSLEVVYRNVCMNPTMVEIICGDDEATQSWRHNTTAREMF